MFAGLFLKYYVYILYVVYEHLITETSIYNRADPNLKENRAIFYGQEDYFLSYIIHYIY